MEADRVIELDMDHVLRQGLWWNAGLFIAFAAAYHFAVEPLSFRFSLSGILFFIAGYLLLIVLHELFHLIGFVLFGRVPVSSLNYGVNLEMGVAYATTDRPVRNNAMRKALMLPFWTTGVLPTVMGFYLESQVLVLLGAMLVAGAIGDFIMYGALRKERNDVWVLDDPKKPKLHLFDRYPEAEEPIS